MEEIKTGSFKILNENDCPEFYANQMHLVSSNTDFLLSFSRSYPSVESHTAIEKILCRIYMSPKYAKSLSEALNQAVKDYEKKYGSITLDPNMVPQSGTTIKKENQK